MLLIPFAATILFAVTPPAAQSAVRWQNVLSQPAAWYGTAEARAIADSVLAWQLDTGAWSKNTDMTKPPASGEKPDARESTIDNGATVTQIRLLARVGAATGDAKHCEAARRAVAYLLTAQYPNGGWPQYFPLRQGYYTRITYNDDAMAGVMMLLWDVADARPPFTFFDDSIRQKARAAVDKGIDVILKTQVRAGGKRTAWGGQHDEVSFEPRPARTFEPVALASAESVGVLRVLMRVEKPDATIVEAVDAGVAWLESVRIDGKPRWARFYEIGTNRPIFAGRDAVVRYKLEEIEEERQKGYSWYGDYAARLIDREYPAWKARLESFPRGFARTIIR
jgi:PelA/Pel-15E family pectate lyase